MNDHAWTHTIDFSDSTHREYGRFMLWFVPCCLFVLCVVGGTDTQTEKMMRDKGRKRRS